MFVFAMNFRFCFRSDLSNELEPIAHTLDFGMIFICLLEGVFGWMVRLPCIYSSTNVLFAYLRPALEFLEGRCLSNFKTKEVCFIPSFFLTSLRVSTIVRDEGSFRKFLIFLRERSNSKRVSFYRFICFMMSPLNSNKER